MMLLLVSFTVFITVAYLAYPLWLALLKPVVYIPDDKTSTIDQVSLVLLSYNGSLFLRKKIDFLLTELLVFKDFELIIIDDHSEDGCEEILNEFKKDPRVRIIHKAQHKGIPDSMNLAVELAKYEYIVFCDQRQQLSENSIKKLVELFIDDKVGAVSACISDYDKARHFSWIRSYENHVKCMESRAGSLIGVYGPLYAIRKECFSTVPEHIRLDDLYLSLKILAKKQVRIMKECLIIDESPAELNDYQRARRYVSGFLQIMNEKGLVRELTVKQKIMLIWHKYLRLHIPLLFLASYIGIGVMGFFNHFYLYPFIFLTFLLIIVALPAKFRLHLKIKNLLKINLYYLFAFIEVNAKHYLFSGNFNNQ